MERKEIKEKKRGRGRKVQTGRFFFSFSALLQNEELSFGGGEMGGAEENL